MIQPMEGYQSAVANFRLWQQLCDVVYWHYNLLPAVCAYFDDMVYTKVQYMYIALYRL